VIVRGGGNPSAATPGKTTERLLTLRERSLIALACPAMDQGDPGGLSCACTAVGAGSSAPHRFALGYELQALLAIYSGFARDSHGLCIHRDEL